MLTNTTDRQRDIVRRFFVVNPLWVEHFEVHKAGVVLVLTLTGSRRGFPFRDRAGVLVSASHNLAACEAGRRRILAAMYHDACLETGELLA